MCDGTRVSQDKVARQASEVAQAAAEAVMGGSTVASDSGDNADPSPGLSRSAALALTSHLRMMQAHVSALVAVVAASPQGAEEATEVALVEASDRLVRMSGDLQQAHLDAARHEVRRGRGMWVLRRACCAVPS